jgi:caffeoyl-CoA O-methyltransferase
LRDLIVADRIRCESSVRKLKKLLSWVRPGGLVVAHNMRVPPPDPQYVNAITTNPDLETVFLNMHSAGIAVTLKKR